MENAIVIWSILSLSFLILELGHPGLLFFLSFSCGAFFSTIAAYLHKSFAMQCIVFFGATFMALGLLRLFLKKFHRATHKTNVEALIGKTGSVTQEISPEKPGYVKVEGEIWLARSSRKIFGIGKEIFVTEVRGAHLIVEEKNNQ